MPVNPNENILAILAITPMPLATFMQGVFVGQCANDWAKTWKERKASTFMGPGTHVAWRPRWGDFSTAKLKQEDTWTNGDMY